MDELIARVTAALGVDANVAKVAIGHVLVFLQKEIPDGPVAELIVKLPGAQEAVEAAASDPGGSGGMLGGLMSGAGGLMALAGKLSGVGLDMGQMQTLAKEVFAYAEGLIGKENVQKIASGVPGLSQFL
jgi:predicted lipid-binding transport protein (Tim44 family)